MDMAVKPIGSIIDAMVKLRDKRRDLAAKDKELEAEFKALEAQVMARFAQEGMAKASGKLGTASLKEEVVATLDGDSGWEKLTAYVKKSGNFHLFQRRFSNPAYRELVALSRGKGVPGLVPFTKTSINLTSQKGE